MEIYGGSLARMKSRNQQSIQRSPTVRHFLACQRRHSRSGCVVIAGGFVIVGRAVAFGGVGDDILVCDIEQGALNTDYEGIEVDTLPLETAKLISAHTRLFCFVKG